MRRNEGCPISVTRRDVLKMMAVGALASSIGGSGFGRTSVAAATSSRAKRTETGDGPYNILFILTDSGALLSSGRATEGLPAAGTRASREEGHRVPEPPDQFVRVHAVAFRTLHRPAYSAHTHV